MGERPRPRTRGRTGRGRRPGPAGLRASPEPMMPVRRPATVLTLRAITRPVSRRGRGQTRADPLRVRRIGEPRLVAAAAAELDVERRIVDDQRLGVDLASWL